eukprot:CAMPEP_0182464226 /NCGR_PEP_ID=MMETSP1319-20130603/8399_1 /TAXON_ID=172717 /ORGANISM="Bolidomonas pacifica, Strain RCC208" /LENGTH=318 /DNA_ID=CAMNT_0024663853 /DNA_START=61 /DNA_END=1017 /DNA_ORIENTATION=+
MPLSPQRKAEYFQKLEGYLDSYTTILVVEVDNVGSKQIQQIRMALRGTAEILMGKNTMIRKIFQQYLRSHPGHPYELLVPRIKGNVGFVFTNADVSAVREKLEENRVPAPARVGSIAPNDVVVPAGPTGCDPGQTAFFQVLQIATKIAKGQIEIVSDVHLVSAGEKVGSSEAALLQKLDIRPFTYGLVVTCVYDNGSVFDPAVLDLTEDDLANKFRSGVANVAALSLAIGFPTQASLPHSIANAFKNLVSIAVECDNFSFSQAQIYKDFLADPSAFACAGGGGGGGDAPAAEAAKVEEEEESAEEMGGMDMFGAEDGY